MSGITDQRLAAEQSDNSCRLELIEIVPLTRDTDGPCTTDGDWSAEGIGKMRKCGMRNAESKMRNEKCGMYVRNGV